jgi:hypothetical protein
MSNYTLDKNKKNKNNNVIESFINKKIHKHRIIFGWLSILFHIIIMSFILITPFFTENKQLILILIWLNAALLTEWYLLGNSILNFSDHLIFDEDNENQEYYNQYQYHTGEKASIFLISISELFDIDIKILGQITTLIPLFLITYMLCKLS